MSDELGSYERMTNAEKRAFIRNIQHPKPDPADALRSVLRQLEEKQKEWTQVPCNADICDSRGRIYGCCRPKGHDGPHETLEDRLAKRYPFLPSYDAKACADALAPIIAELKQAVGKE